MNAPVLHARDGRLYLPATANYSVCKQMFVSERRERSVDTVDLELDRLISRRASQDTRPDPDELEPGYLESVRRHHEKIRQRNRWEWVRFFDRMAESHARIAQDYERRAEELCTDERRTA